VFSTSPAVLLSDVVVGGNFGNRTGPTLLSAFANDADDADAVISANDTLILTFSEPTNQAGYPAGQLLPSSWVAAALDAPPAPASAWQAVWINATKLRLTVVNASGVDLVAWGATVGPTDLALTAMVGVLTGAAIRKEAPILVENLLAARRGEPLQGRYDGYASCPLVTGYGRVILAEFDYDGKPAESFPFDQSQERYSMYMLKAYGLPEMYWNGMLKGRM
jgi:hypothetical protein